VPAAVQPLPPAQQARGSTPGDWQAHPALPARAQVNIPFKPVLNMVANLGPVGPRNFTDQQCCGSGMFIPDLGSDPDLCP
jgi:hypothetical protein